MATADYRLCDRCGGKAFYDANLDYSSPNEPGFVAPTEYANAEFDSDLSLWNVGSWAVLCRKCSKTHLATIVERGEK